MSAVATPTAVHPAEAAAAGTDLASQAHSPGTALHLQPLSHLRRGQQGIIVAVSDERGLQLARRLVDLGLEPGRTVSVGRCAPLGDPTTYRVADYTISLRRRDAALVTVEVEA